MKLRQLIAACHVALGVCAVHAQGPEAGSGQNPGMESGMGHEIGLSAEEGEKRCQANPERCAQIKQAVQKRREEWKKLCDADPKACEEKRAQLREKIEGRGEHRQERREDAQERRGTAPEAPTK